MAKKIKHAIAYIILAVLAGGTIYWFTSALWYVFVKPSIEFGIVKSLTVLLFLIGLLTTIWIIFWALGKLIDWLLKE